MAQQPFRIRTKDGDTLVYPDGRTVRLTGVNTPEVSHPNAFGGQSPEAPLAAEAQAYAEQYANDPNAQPVRPLLPDTDVYGRSLEDVQIPNRASLSEELVVNYLGRPTSESSEYAQDAYNSRLAKKLGMVPYSNEQERAAAQRYQENAGRLDLGQQKVQGAPRTLGRSFSKAVERGGDNVQAMFGALTKMAGETLGVETLTEYGDAVTRRNRAEAAANRPAIETFRDIDTVSDAMHYAVEALGENALNIATVAGTAGVGAMTNLALKRLAGAAAAEVTTANAIAAGAKAGAFAGNVALNTGESKMSLDAADPGGDHNGEALLLGLAKGAVETAGDFMQLGAVADAIKNTAAKTGVPRGRLQAVVRAMTRRTGQQFLIEGGTEGLQTVIDQVGIEMATGKQTGSPDEIIDAFLKGGITGGAFGLVTGTTEGAAQSLAPTTPAVDPTTPAADPTTPAPAPTTAPANAPTTPPMFSPDARSRNVNTPVEMRTADNTAPTAAAIGTPEFSAQDSPASTLPVDQRTPEAGAAAPQPTMEVAPAAAPEPAAPAPAPGNDEGFQPLPTNADMLVRIEPDGTKTYRIAGDPTRTNHTFRSARNALDAMKKAAERARKDAADAAREQARVQRATEAQQEPPVAPEVTEDDAAIIEATQTVEAAPDEAGQTLTNKDGESTTPSARIDDPRVRRGAVKVARAAAAVPELMQLFGERTRRLVDPAAIKGRPGKNEAPTNAALDQQERDTQEVDVALLGDKKAEPIARLRAAGRVARAMYNVVAGATSDTLEARKSFTAPYRMLAAEYARKSENVVRIPLVRNGEVAGAMELWGPAVAALGRADIRQSRDTGVDERGMTGSGNDAVSRERYFMQGVAAMLEFADLPEGTTLDPNWTPDADTIYYGSRSASNDPAAKRAVTRKDAQEQRAERDKHATELDKIEEQLGDTDRFQRRVKRTHAIVESAGLKFPVYMNRKMISGLATALGVTDTAAQDMVLTATIDEYNAKANVDAPLVVREDALAKLSPAKRKVFDYYYKVIKQDSIEVAKNKPSPLTAAQKEALRAITDLDQQDAMRDAEYVAAKESLKERAEALRARAEELGLTDTRGARLTEFDSRDIIQTEGGDFQTPTESADARVYDTEVKRRVRATFNDRVTNSPSQQVTNVIADTLRVMPNAATVTVKFEALPKDAKAYIDLTTNTVTISPDVTDPAEVRALLQHEVVVHYGLRRLLAPEQFKQMLDMVVAQAESTPKLKAAWGAVKRDYADAPLHEQAEEVIAKIAEAKTSWGQKVWSDIVAFIKAALSKLGWETNADNQIDNLLEASYANLRAVRGALLHPAFDGETKGRFARQSAAEYAKEGARKTRVFAGSTAKFAGKVIERLRSTYHQLEQLSPELSTTMQGLEVAVRSAKGHWMTQFTRILDKHIGAPTAGVLYSTKQRNALAAALKLLRDNADADSTDEAFASNELARDIKAYIAELMAYGKKSKHAYTALADLDQGFPRPFDIQAITENTTGFEEWLQQQQRGNGRGIDAELATAIRQFIERGPVALQRMSRTTSVHAVVRTLMQNKSFMDAAARAGWLHKDPYTALTYLIDYVAKTRVTEDTLGGLVDIHHDLDPVLAEAMAESGLNFTHLKRDLMNWGYKMDGREHTLQSAAQEAIDLGLVKVTREKPNDPNSKIVKFEVYRPRAVVDKAAADVAARFNEDAAGHLRYLVDAATGDLRFHAPAEIRKFNEIMVMVESLALLPLSVLGSISELAVTITREAFTGGDLRANLKALVRSFRKDHRELTRALGIAHRGMVAGAISGMHGFIDAQSVPARVMNAFFTLNGQVAWTNMTRGGALAVGMDAFVRHAKALDSGSAREKAAARLFFGMDGDAPVKLTEAEAKEMAALAAMDSAQLSEVLTKQQLYEGKYAKFAEFMHHFVDSTNVMPSPGDLPAVAQNPYWRWAFMYKPFLYAVGRRVTAAYLARAHALWGADATAQSRIAALMPVVLLASSAYALAIVSNAMRDSLRGVDHDDDEEWDKFLRTVSRTGLLGPADMLPTAFNGYSSPLVSVLGPVASHADTLLTHGPFSEQFVRRTVPVVGQFPLLWK